MSRSSRPSWQEYANTAWWGHVQPPQVGVCSGVGTNIRLNVGWSQKIADPATILMEFLMADLCERFTLLLAANGWLSIDYLAERLKVPADAVHVLAALMRFEAHGNEIRLPDTHPLGPTALGPVDGQDDHADRDDDEGYPF
jgi:hypothetical protein